MTMESENETATPRGIPQVVVLWGEEHRVTVSEDTDTGLVKYSATGPTKRIHGRWEFFERTSKPLPATTGLKEAIQLSQSFTLPRGNWPDWYIHRDFRAPDGGAFSWYEYSFEDGSEALHAVGVERVSRPERAEVATSLGKVNRRRWWKLWR